ncbi:MAG: hypothetical protein AB8B96_11515 [Lysobacterales bacterium]
MTAVLGWFSSQLIATGTPGKTVLPMRPVAPGALDNTVRSAQCDGLKTSLEKELLSAGSCNVDTDCTIIRLDCPFACVSAVAEANFVRIYRMQDDYTLACGTCQSACTEDPPPVACRRGRCVLDVSQSLGGNRRGLPERPERPPQLSPEENP